MKRNNNIEGFETRKSYRRKKKLKEILKKVKRIAIILFIGFILGIIYSNLFMRSYRDENKLEVEIPYQSENTSNLPEKTYVDNTCTYDEVSCKIKNAAIEHEIDWRIAIAISMHETGKYTSYAFKSLNNVGGMMYWDGTKSALKSFNSLDEGIEAFVKNLKNNYYDLGLDTIEKIQPKYAPVGAANDPSNLNSYWVSGVTRYYDELGK